MVQRSAVPEPPYDELMDVHPSAWSSTGRSPIKTNDDRRWVTSCVIILRRVSEDRSTLLCTHELSEIHDISINTSRSAEISFPYRV